MKNPVIAASLAFPNIDPIIFSFGPLSFHWYGLGYVIGILFAWYYGKYLLKHPALWKENKPPMAPKKLDDLVLTAAIGVVAGGRLGEVLFYRLDYFLAHPLKIFAVWDGGMSFHGGLLGTMVAIILFSLKNHLSVWSTLDTIAAGAPIGLGIVRICNFINSELWGRVTNVPWAVRFPNGGMDHAGNFLARHPSQLYEAILEGPVLFFILAFLIFQLKALKKPGLISGSFSFFYGIARFFVEFFREPSTDYIAGDWLTMGMLLSLPMILIGFILILYTLTCQKYKS